MLDSLAILAVVGCQLTSIEPCFNSLTQLRKLCLQDNAIRKIENLENCVQLEELWLFSNKVVGMENFNKNSALSHLNLADNLIRRIGDVTSLTSLAHLDLSGNPIAELNAIDNISDLPMLEQLAFSSPLFESCPITELPNYQCYVLSTIAAPRFAMLDNVRVSKEQMQTALNEYVQLMGRMLSSIEDAENNYTSKVAKLEAETKADEDALSLLENKCMQQLSEVKDMVDKGRAKVEKEHLHLQDIRRGNEEKLRDELKVILEEYKDMVSEVLKEQEKALVEEGEVWNEIVKTSSFELRVHETLVEVMLSTQGKIVFAEIRKDSPEFLFVQNHFLEAKSSKLKVTGGCLIYNDSAEIDPNSPEPFHYAKLEVEEVGDFVERRRAKETYESLDECAKGIKGNGIIALCKNVAVVKDSAVYCLVFVMANKDSKKSFIDDKLAILMNSTIVFCFQAIEHATGQAEAAQRLREESHSEIHGNAQHTIGAPKASVGQTRRLSAHQSPSAGSRNHFLGRPTGHFQK